jgi:pimeloyl-ACP methyl ester carboxylesterase
MAAELQTARITGGSAFYLEGGNARTSRAIVLIHGFPFGVRMWEPQLESIRRWRVIVPALAGFDGSTPPEHPSIASYGAGVLALLTSLGIERAVFCGLSMGGYVTFGILRQAASRAMGVILADTRSSADSDAALENRRRMLLALGREGPSAVAREMLPRLFARQTPARRPDLVGSVRQMIEGQSHEAIAAAIEAMMLRPDSSPLLREMLLPTLVIVGDEDALTPPADSQQIHEAVAGSTLVRIPGAGHLSNLEEPEAFGAAVQAFLDSMSSQ